MRFMSDTRAVPWIFAENAVAIIGACVPTLAPLWTNQQPHSTGKSFFSPRSSHSKAYNNFEGHHNFRRDPDEASVDRLVGLGGLQLISKPKTLPSNIGHKKVSRFIRLLMPPIIEDSLCKRMWVFIKSSLT